MAFEDRARGLYGGCRLWSSAAFPLVTQCLERPLAPGVGLYGPPFSHFAAQHFPFSSVAGFNFIPCSVCLERSFSVRRRGVVRNFLRVPLGPGRGGSPT